MGIREVSKLNIIVICHGKSEVQICKFIKTKLRLKMGIESEKNGAKSIQITSINNFLNNKNFKTKEDFRQKYPDVNFDDKDKFKIFIIMDTDDCSDSQKKQFINKSLFKKTWFKDYIVPIYNIENLEDVLIKADIKFRKKTEKEMKKEYIEIFPTKNKYKENEILDLEEFSKNLKLKSRKFTNLDKFIDYCLQIYNED